MLGVPGILEHPRALQVLRAVQAAGEPEVTAQVCAGVVEGAQDWIRLRRHKANISSATSLDYKALRPPGRFTNLYSCRVMERCVQTSLIIGGDENMKILEKKSLIVGLVVLVAAAAG